MRYTWDPDKDALNRRKHKLALTAGIDALRDPHRDSWNDDRYDYEEVRKITLGLGKRGVLYVVTTALNDDCTRLISVRRADDDEIERYGLGRA